MPEIYVPDGNSPSQWDRYCEELKGDESEDSEEGE